MPTPLDIDLAALTLATAHHRLIKEVLIDQPSFLSSLDSYQRIYENLNDENNQGDMYVNNYLLGVSFSLFTSNKTW